MVFALGFGSCTCAQLAGPGPQLRQAALGFSGLKSLPGCGLSISHLQISRITAEPELSPPRVVFSFDLDGALGQTTVSALGVEKVPMQATGSGYKPSGSALPQLERTLAALRPKSKGVRRWLIRVDIDKTDIGEDLADGGRRTWKIKTSDMP